ncbi:ribonuclease H-like domain-containing protein [bacterium]|nr:ribonuclease H-like domain-containing protein [bacterium]
MHDYIVFDLETQRSAQDVGGWNNIAEMKMSVGVLWDSKLNDFRVYLEDEVMDLIKHLKSGPIIIGYNHIGFDYTVLSGYASPEFERQRLFNELKCLDNLDLLQDLKDRIGKRIKLDSVARPTLNVGKSADGLMALKWYKEYLSGDQDKLNLIIDYCCQDVAVTRDVYLYGLQNKEIIYEDKFEGLKTIPVDWGVNSSEPEVESDSEQLSF